MQASIYCWYNKFKSVELMDGPGTSMKMLSLVHTMLVNMLVILWMVTQEQLARFVHAGEDYAT